MKKKERKKQRKNRKEDLNKLIKLYDDEEKTNPEVNITMSKYPILKYI